MKWIQDAQAHYPRYHTDPIPVYEFIIDRLKVTMRDEGIRHDHIEAVVAATEDSDIVKILHRVGAIKEFLQSEDGEHLLTAHRRAANILRDEGKKDGASYGAEYEDTLLSEPSEKELGPEITCAWPTGHRTDRHRAI